MKTLINSLIEGNGNVLNNYFDDIKNKNCLNIKVSDLTPDELIAYNNWIAVIQTRLNALPRVKAKVKFINLLDGTFSISGEYYPLKTQRIIDLTPEQKVITNALYNFVLNYTGSQLLSLEGEIGALRVVINGVVYSGQEYLDLVSASGNVIYNSILLTIDIFNS
jgi:hypothetical protein